MGEYKRGNIWYIDFYLQNGERKRERIGTSKKKAVSVLHKRRTEVIEGRYFDIKEKEKVYNFKEITEDFLKYSKNNKRSFDKDEYIVRHLTEFFGNSQIEKITPSLIEEYKSKRLKVGMKPATVNREIAGLKCMFNFAMRNKKAKENPMKYVKLLQENNTRVRYLSEEELVKLLNACTKCIRPIVIAALVTGMRKGEILSLKWEDVNFSNSVILLKNTKSGRNREVIIGSVLAGVLEECRKNSDGIYVFCNEEGKKYLRIDTLFQSIVKRSGIIDFHFHDLRHTAASYLVMSGVDLLTVKNVLGHQKIETTLRYAHLSPAHKKEAVEVLGKKVVTIWSQDKIKEAPDKHLSTIWRGTQVAEGAGLLKQNIGLDKS